MKNYLEEGMKARIQGKAEYDHDIEFSYYDAKSDESQFKAGFEYADMFLKFMRIYEKKKKKTKVTNRNGYAKALESPTHRHKVIPDKRKKKEKSFLDRFDFLGIMKD